MTPQGIITEARYILNDATATYRQSDSELLGYVNSGIREVSALQPMVFASVGDVACVAASVEQAVTFTDAQALIDVMSIHDGNALTVFDWDAMNRFNPGWRTDTAAPARQWARIAGDPLRFFIYPKAPISQVLDIMYVRVPVTLALTDTISEVPAAYTTALVDYVVYRADSKDDEHSNSGRAVASYQAFVSKIKG